MLINLAAFVVIVAGIMSAKSLLVPFLLAFFLAIICAPPLYWLRKKNVPQLLAVAMVVGGVIILQLALTSLIGSSLADFTRALPQYQSRLQVIVKDGIQWVEQFGFNVTDDIIMEQFDPGKLMGIIGAMLNNLLSMLTNTFIILLTFMFIMLEAAGIPSKLKAMAGGAPDALDKYSKITTGVNRYLFLKTLTSMATGLLAWFSLQMIGVDFPILWGFIAFILNFVPTIGSIIAAVPAVLLALVQLGVAPAITTAVVYVCINVGIGSILEPRLMGAGVGLSTLIIFISMAFWGWVLGPVGMLLSVPLTMTLKIAMQANEKTEGFALMLGSNAEAAKVLASLSQEKNE